MSQTANNSFAEKTRHLKARTLAAWRLQNAGQPEFNGVQGAESDLTTRQTGQITYFYQATTSPVLEDKGCACSATPAPTCNQVGPAPFFDFSPESTVQLESFTDNEDGTYTIGFSWNPVPNATGYSFESTTPGSIFEFTGPTSATITSTNSGPEWTITALNNCSSVTSNTIFYCFLAGSLVRMADGSNKAIEEVAVGDLVVGAFGEVNPVLALHRSKLGSQRIININNDHKATENHPHISPDRKFYAANIAALENNTYGRSHTVIDFAGDKVQMMLHGLKKGRVQQLAVGIMLQTTAGPKLLESLEYETMSPDTDLYNLVVGGSHTYNVDGYAVTGWPREDDFNYDSWEPRVL
jgi:hypothetical protein